jgi:hypothetical protein
MSEYTLDQLRELFRKPEPGEGPRASVTWGEACDAVRFLIAQVDAKDELLAAYEGTRFPQVGGDLQELASSLKDRPKPGECRQVPDNVANAMRHLCVPYDRDTLGEIYNRVMRSRQVDPASQVLNAANARNYLSDMEAMQDVVRAILVRGILCLQELFAAHAFLKANPTQPQATQPDPKEGMTVTQLREFSRALGAFQERVDHLLEDAER